MSRLRFRRAPMIQRPAARRFAPQARSARRGAHLVEAALVMNIFLLFIFAIMELGHFVMVKQLMDNAARDGARARSRPGRGSRIPRPKYRWWATNQPPREKRSEPFPANPCKPPSQFANHII